jgi:hypothetical protein
MLPKFEQGMEYYLKKDYVKSAEIWTVLADTGDNNALVHLALLYKEGLGVNQSIKMYFELLFKASEQGHAVAKDLLAGYLSSKVDKDSKNVINPPAEPEINGSDSSKAPLAAIEKLSATVIPKYDRKLSGILYQTPTDDILKLFPLFSGRQLKTIGKESLPDHYQPDFPLTEILLSDLTRNTLLPEYSTIGDLLLCPYPHLLKQRNFGRKSLREIHEAVSDCILKDDAKVMGDEHYTSFEKMVTSWIYSVIDKITHRDIVLWMGFQFNGGNKPTLQEVGEKYNVSRERIRQIVHKSEGHLKKPANLNRIKRLWVEIENIIDSGGGILGLHQLSMALQVKFLWESPPNPQALITLLNIYPSLECEELDGSSIVIFSDSQCLLCSRPKSELKKVFIDSDTKSLFLAVFSKIISDKCQAKCRYRTIPLKHFHHDFIKYLISQSRKICFIQGQIIYSGKKKLLNSPVLSAQNINVEMPAQVNSSKYDGTKPIATSEKRVCHVDYNKLVTACITKNSSNLSKREKQEFGKIRTVYRALTGVGKKDSITSRYIMGLSPDIHPTHISVIRRYLPLLMPYLPQNVVQNLNQISGNFCSSYGGDTPKLLVVDSVDNILQNHEFPMSRSEIFVKLKGQFTESDVDKALHKSNRFIGIGDGYYDLSYRWQNTSCEALLSRLPLPCREFVSYLISNNQCSYKLVLSFLFISGMDANGSMELLILKNRFYNFYLSRKNDGKIVEAYNFVISNITGLSKSVVVRAIIEPLKSFINSSYFVIKNDIIKLQTDLAKDCNSYESKSILKIILLKSIEIYYNDISMLIPNKNIKIIGIDQENQSVNAELELKRNKTVDEVIVFKNNKKKKIVL